jgi:hypothetical protein
MVRLDYAAEKVAAALSLNDPALEEETVIA